MVVQQCSQRIEVVGAGVLLSRGQWAYGCRKLIPPGCCRWPLHFVAWVLQRVELELSYRFLQMFMSTLASWKKDPRLSDDESKSQHRSVRSEHTILVMAY